MADHRVPGTEFTAARPFVAVRVRAAGPWRERGRVKASRCPVHPVHPVDHSSG
ncbi:hypothetical protein SSCG_03691 [Streptomyces clavuligerus]|nr:hypothetical protein SSCG_03691 [Streptomyces clavuligerus]